MSTLDLLPGAEALRQLTGRTNPPGHLLAGIGVFAVGIFAGAALAVLFTPKSGAELRQEIGARVGHLRGKIANTEAGAAECGERA